MKSEDPYNKGIELILKDEQFEKKVFDFCSNVVKALKYKDNSLMHKKVLFYKDIEFTLLFVSKDVRGKNINSARVGHTSRVIQIPHSLSHYKNDLLLFAILWCVYTCVTLNEGKDHYSCEDTVESDLMAIGCMIKNGKFEKTNIIKEMKSTFLFDGVLNSWNSKRLELLES